MKWRILPTAAHPCVLLYLQASLIALYFTLRNISQLLLLSRTTSHPTAPALQSAQRPSEKPRPLSCPPPRAGDAAASVFQAPASKRSQQESGWRPSSPHCEHSQGGWLANSCLSKAKLQWTITITPKKQWLQEYHLYLSRCSNSVHAKPRNNAKLTQFTS